LRCSVRMARGRSFAGASKTWRASCTRELRGKFALQLLRYMRKTGDRLTLLTSEFFLSQYSRDYFCVAIAFPSKAFRFLQSGLKASKALSTEFLLRALQGEPCGRGALNVLCRPNVRAKLAPTVWRAGRLAQNGPQALRRTTIVTRRWCSA
jgi:hypothetical protein